MRQIILNYIIVLAISSVLFVLFSINASLDTSYMLSLLIILIAQTSLIIAILLARK